MPLAARSAETDRVETASSRRKLRPTRAVVWAALGGFCCLGVAPGHGRKPPWTVSRWGSARPRLPGYGVIGIDITRTNPGGGRRAAGHRPGPLSGSRGGHSRRGGRAFWPAFRAVRGTFGGTAVRARAEVRGRWPRRAAPFPKPYGPVVVSVLPFSVYTSVAGCVMPPPSLPSPFWAPVGGSWAGGVRKMAGARGGFDGVLLGVIRPGRRGARTRGTR
jgi:hypothetical protein